MTWQPRATAPRDGKRFLARCINSNGYFGKRYTVQEARWVHYPNAEGVFRSLTGDPITHWMPLPDEPEDEW